MKLLSGCADCRIGLCKTSAFLLVHFWHFSSWTIGQARSTLKYFVIEVSVGAFLICLILLHFSSVVYIINALKITIQPDQHAAYCISKYLLSFSSISVKPNTLINVELSPKQQISEVEGTFCGSIPTAIVAMFKIVESFHLE